MPHFSEYASAGDAFNGSSSYFNDVEREAILGNVDPRRALDFITKIIGQVDSAYISADAAGTVAAKNGLLATEGEAARTVVQLSRNIAGIDSVTSRAVVDFYNQAAAFDRAVSSHQDASKNIIAVDAARKHAIKLSLSKMEEAKDRMTDRVLKDGFNNLLLNYKQEQSEVFLGHDDELAEGLNEADLTTVVSSINVDAFQPSDKPRIQAIKDNLFSDANKIWAAPGLRGTAATPLSEGEKKYLKDALDSVGDLRKLYLPKKANPDSKENRIALSELDKIELAILQILHEHRVLFVGGSGTTARQEYLRPSSKDGVPPQLFGQVQEFIGTFAKDIERTESIGRRMGKLAPGEVLDPLTASDRAFLTDFANKVNDYSSNYAIDVQEMYPGGVLPLAAATDLVFMVDYFKKYPDWINRILSSAGAPAAAGAAGGAKEKDAAGGDDEITWRNYFDRIEHTPEGAIPELKKKYMQVLLDERTNLGLTDTMTKGEAKYNKYFALVQHLKKRTEPGAEELIALINETIALFNAANPFSNSRLLVSSEDDVCTKAVVNGGFDRHTIDYFFNIKKEAGKGYEHVEILKKAKVLLEEYFFEIPDLNIKDKKKQTEDGINFVRGWFSFFTAKWMRASAEMKGDLIQRLQFDLLKEAKFASLDKNEQAQIIQTVIEMYSTLNTRTHLFAICYAVGMSPPNGMPVNDIRDHYPIAAQMYDAAKLGRLIPYVVEGGVIPEEFLNQMEKMITQAKLALGKTAPQEITDAVGRLKVLRRSIALSNLVRRLHRIPKRFHMEMQTLDGHDYHHSHGKVDWMSYEPKPGDQVREKLQFLTPYFDDIYLFATGPHAEQVAGLEMSTYMDAKKAAISLEHKVNSEISTKGATPQEVQDELVLELTDVLSVTSPLKSGDVLINGEEVVEMYLQRMSYLIRHYNKKYNPLNELLFGLDQSKSSLITKFRNVLKNGALVEYSFPNNPHFAHPVLRGPKKLTAKEFLLAHLPRWMDNPRVYKVMRNYQTEPKEVGWPMSRLLKARIALLSRGDSDFTASYDHDTLRKLPLKKKEPDAKH